MADSSSTSGTSPPAWMFDLSLAPPSALTTLSSTSGIKHTLSLPSSNPLTPTPPISLTISDSTTLSLPQCRLHNHPISPGEHTLSTLLSAVAASLPSAELEHLTPDERKSLESTLVSGVLGGSDVLSSYSPPPLAVVLSDPSGRTCIDPPDAPLLVSVPFPRSIFDSHRLGIPVLLPSSTLAHALPNSPARKRKAPPPPSPPSPPDAACGSDAAPAGEKSSGVGVVYDVRMLDHFHPTMEHPERPERISAIISKLEKDNVLAAMTEVPAVEAEKDDLVRVHAPEHVEWVANIPSLSERETRAAMRQLDSIYLNPYSHLAASVAAGSVTSITRAVARGELKAGLAVVRPPGHHAEPPEPSGFCFYNNVGVAAGAVLADGTASRILVIDWDVHHGNGTQKMFEDSDQVLYLSIHRYDNGRFYPGNTYGSGDSIGSGQGEGYSVNVGWNVNEFRPPPVVFSFDFNAPDGADGGEEEGEEDEEEEEPEVGTAPGDAEYVAVFEDLVLPIARAYRPDLIIVSAGFDAGKGDPLGGCAVSPPCYAYMTQALQEVGAACGAGVVVVLEGGYNLETISNSMSACAQALVGQWDGTGVNQDNLSVHSSATTLISTLKQGPLSQFWPTLSSTSVPSSTSVASSTSTSPSNPL